MGMYKDVHVCTMYSRYITCMGMYKDVHVWECIRMYMYM